ncbi:MAG: alpha-amylase family glycosyl hydrolase, partial [Ornithinibacter sp.]
MGHSTPGLGANQPGLRHDPEWFRTAVFYEVLVRAFGDSTGSGEGDFAGIVNRLDYLQWLGVDCLWLP